MESVKGSLTSAVSCGCFLKGNRAYSVAFYGSLAFCCESRVCVCYCCHVCIRVQVSAACVRGRQLHSEESVRLIWPLRRAASITERPCECVCVLSTQETAADQYSSEGNTWPPSVPSSFSSPCPWPTDSPCHPSPPTPLPPRPKSSSYGCASSSPLSAARPSSGLPAGGCEEGGWVRGLTG